MIVLDRISPKVKPVVFCILGFIVILLLNEKLKSDLQTTQQITAREVEVQRLCKIPALENRTQFYKYFANAEYKCSNVSWFGTTKGGGRKAVCMDSVFNITPGDCHVLSFGINNDFSFDDDFDHFGCKVYAFDPTMDMEDQQRSPNSRFLKLGIGNIKGKRKVGMGRSFNFLEVDRYENILERLGLTNTIIDYIKMDVELSELEFFQDIFRNSPHLLKNIKQMEVEVHHGYHGEGIEGNPGQGGEMGPMSTFQIFWQYFHELRCHGFKVANVKKPHMGSRWSEPLWVRN